MNTAVHRSPRRPATRHAWAGLVLALALPLVVALWGAVALWLGAPAAWMAVIVAADASLLLSLLRTPPGAARTAWALGFLVLTAAASLWMMAAGVIGPSFGLLPWESALRLGPVLFGVIAGPWATPANVAWLAAAVALTLWWNR
ncbi:hypothetical protein GCM10028794_27330 [Silanimonas algicola]